MYYCICFSRMQISRGELHRSPKLPWLVFEGAALRWDGRGKWRGGDDSFNIPTRWWDLGVVVWAYIRTKMEWTCPPQCTPLLTLLSNTHSRFPAMIWGTF